MDREEIRQKFSPLLDGELPPEERAAVEAKLAMESDLLRELDSLKRVDDLFRRMPAVKAPADFDASVRKRLRPTVFELTRKHFAAQKYAPIIATAAALLVVSTAALYEYKWSAPRSLMEMANAKPVPSFANPQAQMQASGTVANNKADLSTLPMPAAPTPVAQPDESMARQNAFDLGTSARVVSRDQTPAGGLPELKDSAKRDQPANNAAVQLHENLEDNTASSNNAFYSQHYSDRKINEANKETAAPASASAPASIAPARPSASNEIAKREALDKQISSLGYLGGSAASKPQATGANGQLTQENTKAKRGDYVEYDVNGDGIARDYEHNLQRKDAAANPPKSAPTASTSSTAAARTKGVNDRYAAAQTDSENVTGGQAGATTSGKPMPDQPKPAEPSLQQTHGAPATDEKQIESKEAETVEARADFRSFAAAAPAPAPPAAPAAPGQVAQLIPDTQRTVGKRSVNLKDNVWRQSDYAGETVIVLTRDSGVLKTLIEKEPGLKVLKDFDKPVIFRAADHWYRLDPPKKKPAK